MSSGVLSNFQVYAELIPHQPYRAQTVEICADLYQLFAQAHDLYL
jgi:Lon protease-like protein